MFVTARRTPPLEETRESGSLAAEPKATPQCPRPWLWGFPAVSPKPPDAHHDEPLPTRHPKFSSKIFRRRAYHSCRRRNIRGIDMIQRTSAQVLRMEGAKNRWLGRPDYSGHRGSLAVKLSAAPVSPKHHHVNAGHQPMSNSETRISLIVGVCEQDPDAGVSLSASTGRC